MKLTKMRSFQSFLRKNIGGGRDASHDSQPGARDTLRKSSLSDPVDRTLRRQRNNFCRSRRRNPDTQTGPFGQQVV